MSLPIRTTTSLETKRRDRILDRHLSTIDARKVVGLAELEAKAQLEAARVHAVGYVGQQALQSVAMVSQLEGQLAAICPMAVGRLQGIADLTALAVAQVVSDAHRRLA